MDGHSDTSFLGTPVTPTIPSTPINVNTLATEVGGIIRPMGRKAAKRKTKTGSNGGGGDERVLVDLRNNKVEGL